MNEIELFVIADEEQPTVRDFVRTLKELDFKIHEINEIDAINTVCNSPCHLIIILSAKQNINTIRTVAQRGLMNGVHLYFIGDPGSVFPGGGPIINNIPGSHFPGLPVDYYQFTCAIECSERTKKSILVVDDDPILLRSVKVWLGEDFDVSLVNSGELALEFLDKHPVDLVLLDYRMPSMSGPDVMKEIRNNPRYSHIPIIFLTGKNDKESVIQVMQMKPDGYLLKNKRPEEVKATVQEFFKHRVAVFAD